MIGEDFISNRTVLVTGGAGFIGSHLVDALVARGCRVSVLDEFSTGQEANLNPSAELYKASTTDRDRVLEAFSQQRPHLVYQLAANTNVPRSVTDPLYDFQTLHGAVNVIDACRHYPVSKLIYVSSGFIYGNTPNKPIKESEPFIPISPYSITKKTIENYLLFYNQVYRVPYVVVRPATVYGPRQTFGAMADYIRKLAKNQQAEIYGDGGKTRDYVFVADAINALLLLPGLSDSFSDPIFNLGTGKETSLNELYWAIARLLQKDPSPIYLPIRPGELEKYSLDSSKIRTALGWEPKYELAEGLRETLRYGGYIAQ